MFRPDDATAVSVLPTPGAVGPNPNYFFGPGTIVTPDGPAFFCPQAKSRP